MSKKSRQIIRDIFRGFLYILGAALFALSLRIFIFASFVVPSPSMKPALLPGDYILVNKLIPGPRLYKNFDFLEGAKVETRRLKGFRAIRRNDVLVFNYPHSKGKKIEMDLNTFFVKRCVAIPGDTFYIDNGFYKVKNVDEVLGNYDNQAKLSQKADSSFKKGTFRCYPQERGYDWNLKHWGPMYIPKVNDVIAIDTATARLYRHVIEYEAEKKIRIRDSVVWLGEDTLRYYVFRQNYYFMTGDYALDSQDSRYWGLVPEDHIVGKAAVVWQSKDMKTGEYRWGRFFKRIK